jgi:hypothetical protein
MAWPERAKGATIEPALWVEVAADEDAELAPPEPELPVPEGDEEETPVSDAVAGC